MRAEPWAKSMNEIHLGAGWFRVFSHHIARVCEFVFVCVCVCLSYPLSCVTLYVCVSFFFRFVPLQYRLLNSMVLRRLSENVNPINGMHFYLSFNPPAKNNS